MRTLTDPQATSCFGFFGSGYVSNTSYHGYSTSGYSVSFWFKHEGQQTGTQRRLFAFGTASGTNPQFVIGTSTNSVNRRDLFLFLSNDSGTLLSASSTTELRDSTWHHVLWTDNNGTCKLYLDGVLDATNFNYTVSGTFNGFANTAIGTQIRNGASTNPVKAGMYDARVYSRVLTATEAANLADGKDVSSASLSLRWIGNQNGGATVIDASGNGRNGTFSSPFFLRESPFYVGRPAVGGNLIYNGDFEIYPENDNVATTTGGRWVDGTAAGSSVNEVNAVGWGFDKSGTVEVQFDTSVKTSGNASLRISTKAVSSYVEARGTPTGHTLSKLRQFYQRARPSTSYTCTYFMKTNLVSGDSNGGAYLAVLEYDHGGTLRTSINGTAVKVTSDWTQYTITFTTRVDTSFIEPRLTLYGHTGTGTLIMDAWFDDITLTETTPVTRSTATGRLAVQDFGMSLALNGSTYVTADTVATTNFGGGLLNEFTFSSWYKSTQSGQRTLMSLGHGTDSIPYVILDVGFAAKQARFTIRNTSSSSDTISSSVLNLCDGNWHHIVGVKEATTIKLYVDGVLIGSDSSLVGGTYTFNKFTIGALGRTSYSNAAFGYVDHSRVWTRALTATEVDTLYRIGYSTPLSTNLVGEWLYASNVNDTSGTGNNGTLTGTATYSTDVPMVARISV